MFPRFYHNSKAPQDLLRQLVGKEISVEAPRDGSYKGEQRIFSGILQYDVNADSFALRNKVI